jgi:hypothetical protein
LAKIATQIAAFPVLLLPIGDTLLAPIDVPDTATFMQVSFPITDLHIGWDLETFVSLDGGINWIFNGGCGRSAAGDSATQSGIIAGLPPGIGRKFKARLILTKPLVMAGIVTVT